MKKFIFSLLAAATLAAPALAQDKLTLTPLKEMPAGVYQLDPTHASLTWQVKHLGLSNYTARFAKFDATLDFNPTALAQSQVTATIDPTSIRTDYPNAATKDFDAELAHGAPWFNAKQFPEIKFVSTQLVLQDGHTGRLTGDLTLLGVTKPVTLTVRFNGGLANAPFSKKPTLGFSASGSLKRTEWGFNHLVPLVGETVNLNIEAEFIHAGTPTPAQP